MKYLASSLLLLIMCSSLAADDGAATRGKQVYEHWCEACHGADAGYWGPDTSLPGTAALEALYKGSKPAVLTDRDDLTPTLIKTFVRNGVSIMPFFRETEISDSDLEDLSTYLSK